MVLRHYPVHTLTPPHAHAMYSQDHASLSQQVTDEHGGRHETGGGRTPGLSKSGRYLRNDSCGRGRHEALGAFHEAAEQEHSQLGAEAVNMRGNNQSNPLSYETYTVDGGGRRYDGSSSGGGGGGGASAAEASFTSAARESSSSFRISEGAVEEVAATGDRDRTDFGDLRKPSSSSTDAAVAGVASVAAASGHLVRVEQGPRAGEGDTMPGLSSSGLGLMPDNWGILQYGLTLENPVAASSLDASPGRKHRLRSGEHTDGLGGSGHGGRGEDRSSGTGNDNSRLNGRVGVDGSPSSTVAMMMDSLSISDDTPHGDPRRSYAGKAKPREGAAGGALMFGRKGNSGHEGSDLAFPDGGASSGRLHEANHADEAGGGGLEGNGGGASFGFLDSRSPKFEPMSDERTSLRQQQQQQQLSHRKQSIPPPLHPTRALGGSPSLGPRHPRRSRPPRVNLDTGRFSPSVGGLPDNVHGTDGSGRGGAGAGAGTGAGAGSSGRFRWSFPPPGMSGGEVGDGPGGALHQASMTHRLDELGATDGHGVGTGTGSGSSGDGNSSAGEGGGRVDGRGAAQWTGTSAGSASLRYGVPRRLVYDGEAGRLGGGGSGGGGGGSEIAGGRGGGLSGLSGSVDSHQYAMLRGHQRGGYQVGHRV